MTEHDLTVALQASRESWEICQDNLRTAYARITALEAALARLVQTSDAVQDNLSISFLDFPSLRAPCSAWELAIEGASALLVTRAGAEAGKESPDV